MHPYDRYFYDPDSHNYTVARFLDDLNTRYGGIDALLFWPTYTNIGIDDRNQFDFFRVMPGGLDAVARVTKELQASGVRVLWPYNPWDTGTRREANGTSDAATFAELLTQTGGDGINGDTMQFVPKEFYTEAVQRGHPIAFEPEGGGTDESLNWSTMGWGYWDYPLVPWVDRPKFLSRGKFTKHVCDRWATRKVDNLQAAWFNGDGFESWENVWGTWNGIVPRDAEAIRRVAAMLRFFGGAGGVLHSAHWEPHTNATIHPAVFASAFTNSSLSVWTIVNRAGLDLDGPQLLVDPQPDDRYFDCYHGSDLTLSASPPTAPPTPAPYYEVSGANCYSGHGGVDIDTDPVSISLSGCTVRCDADPDCGCVTYLYAEQQCWKRASCEPALFDQSSQTSETSSAPSASTTAAAAATASKTAATEAEQYSVYLKRRGYWSFPGRNCYNGHGGREIDTSAASGLSAEACRARCDADSACACTTYRASDSSCWKRSGCVLTSAFEIDPDYEVFISAARMPPPPPPSPPLSALSFPLEQEGYGCVVRIQGEPGNILRGFLSRMSTMSAVPLGQLSAEWKYLQQEMMKIPRTSLASAAPPGTVFIPAANYTFVSSGIEIEGDDQHGVDVQFPWETHPQREHSATLSLSAFYMDKFTVTNANYSAYLAATSYRPADPTNWLRAWNGSATPPSRIANAPVTYVSLNEARSYCAWAGGRLPHSYEWQYAAQGTDGRIYPWGSEFNSSLLPAYCDHWCGGPGNVGAHSPEGDSPFGVADLVGGVWQYTDEFRDEHTRAVLLRGGSNYRPMQSSWYFPRSVELTQHNKYFLFDASYERAATLGFRCVIDAA